MEWIKTVAIFFLFSFSIAFAEPLDPEKKSFLPMETTHANWIFSGVITNENNEQYGYFFQVHRVDNYFQATTALIEAESKQLLFYDKSSVVIENPGKGKWQIGQAFLMFNPINENWVFGIKTKDKKGFNFKVDMLHHPEKIPAIQSLRSGVDLFVNQTGRLNGHVRLEKDDRDQFVTAKNTWFRHAWLTEEQNKPHLFSSLFCRFNDGSGVYSVNLREEDAHRGAVAGLCDEHGLPLEMSQFIDVKVPESGILEITIPSPDISLVLPDLIKQNSVMAGFITKGAKEGFCMLSEDALGEDIG